MMTKLTLIIIFNSLLCFGVFGQSLCSSDFYIENKDSICSILQSRMIAEDSLHLSVIPFSEKLFSFAAPNYIFDISQSDTIALILLNKQRKVIDICFNRYFEKGKYAIYLTKQYDDLLYSRPKKEIIIILNKTTSFELVKSVMVR